jgi:sugar/nucleoside kinase (ribokinase family)
MTGRPGVPDVVVLGSASRDMTDEDPRGWRLGGGVTYASLALGRLGLRAAALIGVDEAAAEAHELALLREAGVDLQTERLAHAPVFRNVERPTGRIQECLDPGDPLLPRPLPASWRMAPIWFVAPVADETRDDWAPHIPLAPALVVGWQGLLRELAAGSVVGRRAPSPSKLVARADLVAISRHDVGPDVTDASLTALLRPGAQLVVTHGSEGGRVLLAGPHGRPGRSLDYPASVADAEVDATGAGDTFLAALTTALAERAEGVASGGLPPVRPQDLAFAAAAASLAVEGPGLAAVPERAAVLARLGRGGEAPS